MIFKSAWRDFETSFQNILDNLQRHKRLVETQASLADFEAAQKARTEVQNNFNALHKAEKKRQRIAVTQWLAPADSSSDQEKFTSIRNLYPGTGHWLLKDRVFKAWYDPLSTAGLILWLYGIPGAGRLLSSFVSSKYPRVRREHRVSMNFLNQIAKPLLQEKLYFLLSSLKRQGNCYLLLFAFSIANTGIRVKTPFHLLLVEF